MSDPATVIARLEWFVEEKENLREGGTALSRLYGDVDGIAFDTSFDTDLSEVKTALEEAREAILREDRVSLFAGEDLMHDLSDTMAATGRDYLEAEAAATDEGVRLQRLIDNSGL